MKALSADVSAVVFPGGTALTTVSDNIRKNSEAGSMPAKNLDRTERNRIIGETFI
jgi:hypothetical protein